MSNSDERFCAVLCAQFFQVKGYNPVAFLALHTYTTGNITRKVDS